VQTLGRALGQYGGNANGEPANHAFDERAEKIIAEVFGDTDACVYGIK
jgi:hypothetical protein